MLRLIVYIKNMNISLSWLKDFVNIPKSLSPEELGLKLTMHTVEIEGVMKEADKYKNIIVGKILEIKKHPNADKLQLAKVDIGSKELRIVCGAPNIKVGQLVPVALVGSILPNGLEIKEVEVRGEKSEGMMCAEDELGLGEDHAGIMILEKAKVGQKFSDYLKLEDVIFELDNKSITHRPDLWCHYGVAREIGAFLEAKMTKEFERIQELDLKSNSQAEKIKVDVADFDLCPRYMAVRMDNIEIKESPKWIQDRLIAVGSRPINNIVDITNYVMLELGQPMHAFDAELVDEIIVRRARKSEVIETLDGEKRELNDSMLVIADSKKPIAIAGVMGGGNSEISEKTTSIIIESANFEATSIRKTSQKLGLRTDASMRFEKSLDPNLCFTALARFVELVKKDVKKSKLSSAVADEKKFELNQGPINLNLDWVNRRIGENIEKSKVVQILSSLGFEISEQEQKPNSEDGEVLEVKIPTWRATKDVSIPEDLMEEIARINGYDNLNPKMPNVLMEAPEINEERMRVRKIKNILSLGAKLTEIYSYPFVGEEQLKKLNIDYSGHIRLANPISTQHTMLRQSLIPNMLEALRFNQARYEKVNIFEIGSVYLNIPGEINKDEKSKDMLPFQEKRLGIVIASDKEKTLLSRAKGVLRYMLNELIGRDLDIIFEQAEDYMSWADEGNIALVKSMGLNLGFVTSLNRSAVQKFGIKKEAVAIELRLSELFSIMNNISDKKYKELPKFPPLERDLSFVVDSKILYNDIKNEIENFDELISAVELFDVYEGEKLGKGKKSLAFHITYQPSDKTLTQEEVDKIQSQLVKKLEDKFEAIIRDF